MPRPRRLLPGEQQRLRDRLNTSPGLALGERKTLRPVQRAAFGVLQAAGIFALVFHGDDGDVQRPMCMFVYWVGAATPNNGEDHDWWYTEDIA